MQQAEQSNVIVALSFDREPLEVLELAEDLAPHVWGFKIHPKTEIAFLRRGCDIISDIKQMGARVFFDGKYHDIPFEVGQWAADDRERGIDMISVHASGGPDMMYAAVEKSGEMLVLAITVLTSIDQDVCTDVYGKPIEAGVSNLARGAKNAGCHGVVASVKEVEMLRECAEAGHCPKIIVTPGIRPADYGKQDDQKRVATPQQAAELGSSFIVVGRPIRNADDPVEAAREISRQFRCG